MVGLFSASSRKQYQVFNMASFIQRLEHKPTKENPQVYKNTELYRNKQTNKNKHWGLYLPPITEAVPEPLRKQN